MWPFREKEKPDTRPATASALAIAESLRNEPQRWKLKGPQYLTHDSGVVVGTGGYTWMPDLEHEPDANERVIADAVDDWVARLMQLPPPPPKPESPDA